MKIQMTARLLLLTSIFFGVMAHAAQAGMRVTLGFGGPLPAFTAHGPDHGSYHRNHRTSPKRQAHRSKGSRHAVKQASAAKQAKAAKRRNVAAASTTPATTTPGTPIEVPTQAPVDTASVGIVNANATIAPQAISLTNSNTALAAAQTAPESMPISAQDNTSIATETASADTEAADRAASGAAEKQDCKKFFPSVGLTLTVACE